MNGHALRTAMQGDDELSPILCNVCLVVDKVLANGIYLQKYKASADLTGSLCLCLCRHAVPQQGYGMEVKMPFAQLNRHVKSDNACMDTLQHLPHLRKTSH